MKEASRIVAESILENFGAISPYVVRQTLADMVFENDQLRKAIGQIFDAWKEKNPQEFHAWFARNVEIALSKGARDE